ncbi:MAG: hypothetical protein AAF678_00375 [Pseudomonadota bacterium]
MVDVSAGLGRGATKARVDIDATRTYSAFGLVIASDFELQALTPVIGTPTKIDLHVKRATGVIRDRNRPADPWFEITPDAQYMFWHVIGGFLVEDERTIRVEPLEDVSDHLVSQALLGLVISIVLDRRGYICLHAGAVDVDGSAAVLLGDKGAGKSTSSAAMMQAGHQPITDDLVAIDLNEDAAHPPRIQPGFPSLKLWPDSIAALELAPHDTDRLIHPKTTKVQKRTPLELSKTPVRFGAGFVLDRTHETEAPRIVRLAPHEALQSVLRYTFLARYGETSLGPTHLVDHMKRCSALVAQVPMFRLIYPEALHRLDDLVALISDTCRAG